MASEIDKLRHQRSMLLDEMKSVLTAIGDSEPSETQREDYASLEKKIEVVDEKLEKELKYQKLETGSVINDYEEMRDYNRKEYIGKKTKADIAPPKVMNDRNGRPVVLYGPQHNICDYRQPRSKSYDGIKADELHIGEAIYSMITGDWGRYPAVAAAMSTTSNTDGGFLVDDFLSSKVIDLARAKMALIRAGAQTHIMEAGEVHFGRVTADPTVSHKAENESQSVGNPTFDRTTLHSYTLFALCNASMEMVQDSPNFPNLIQDMLTSAIANKFDNLCLVGAGTLPDNRPIGIINHDGVQTTGSVGSPDWDDFSNSLTLIEQENGEPNCYILSPAVKKSLIQLKSGDGTNSAKLYRSPPEDVAALERIVTEQLPDDTAIVCQGNTIVLGFREQMRIDISYEAGEAFERNQVYVRGVMRGDCMLEHPAWVATLTGIS